MAKLETATVEEETSVLKDSPVEENAEKVSGKTTDGLIRISEKDKADLMTFKEMRERLLNKDKIREQQLKEEKEEEDKERREERARLEKIRKEEKRAAGKAKWESEF